MRLPLLLCVLLCEIASGSAANANKSAIGGAVDPIYEESRSEAKLNPDVELLELGKKAFQAAALSDEEKKKVEAALLGKNVAATAAAGVRAIADVQGARNDAEVKPAVVRGDSAASGGSIAAVVDPLLGKPASPVAPATPADPLVVKPGPVTPVTPAEPLTPEIAEQRAREAREKVLERANQIDPHWQERAIASVPVSENSHAGAGSPAGSEAGEARAEEPARPSAAQLVEKRDLGERRDAVAAVQQLAQALGLKAEKAGQPVDVIRILQALNADGRSERFTEADLADMPPEVLSTVQAIVTTNRNDVRTRGGNAVVANNVGGINVSVGAPSVAVSGSGSAPAGAAAVSGDFFGTKNDKDRDRLLATLQEQLGRRDRRTVPSVNVFLEAAGKGSLAASGGASALRGVAAVAEPKKNWRDGFSKLLSALRSRLTGNESPEVVEASYTAEAGGSTAGSTEAREHVLRAMRGEMPPEEAPARLLAGLGALLAALGAPLGAWIFYRRKSRRSAATPRPVSRTSGKRPVSKDRRSAPRPRKSEARSEPYSSGQLAETIVAPRGSRHRR